MPVNANLYLPVLGHEPSIGCPYGTSIVQLLIISLRYCTSDHVNIVFSRRLGQNYTCLAIGNALSIFREMSYLFHITIY